MNTEITPLERTVLDLLSTRENKHRKLLAAQILHAQVEQRQVTSVGFITHFSVPKNTNTLVTMSKRKVFEIYAEHPYTHAGAEFLLWLENGMLKYLEGYVFVGNWPAEECDFHFNIAHSHLCADLVSIYN